MIKFLCLVWFQIHQDWWFLNILALLGRWDRRKKRLSWWLISSINDYILVVNYRFIHNVVLWTSCFRYIRITKLLYLMSSHITQEFNMLICSHQLAIEYLYMSFQLLYLFRFWIIILNRFILNRPSFGCVLKCTIILSKVLITRM